MGFTNDYSQAQEPNGLKPEGDYEVVIVKAAEKQTKNGKTGLNFSMVIRNDVDQKYKDGYIFHTLWKRREPTAADMQVNGYGFGQIMALGKAAGLPDGKDYADLTEYLKDLVGKPVLAHLVHEEYNGEKRERISWLNPTKHPEVRHVMKKKPDVQHDGYAKPTETYAAPAAASAPGQDFQPMPLDDDLPF